jgi:ATP-dependent Clp protease ATP-binding subunit ClpA
MIIIHLYIDDEVRDCNDINNFNDNDDDDDDDG